MNRLLFSFQIIFFKHVPRPYGIEAKGEWQILSCYELSNKLQKRLSIHNATSNIMMYKGSNFSKYH